MSTAVTGVVRGKTIALDEPVPRLDGQRVRVPLEQVPSRVTSIDSELPIAEQARLLREWAESGPQGPLDADEVWSDDCDLLGVAPGSEGGLS